MLIGNSGLKIISLDDLDQAASTSVNVSQIVQMARKAKLGVSFNFNE